MTTHSDRLNVAWLRGWDDAIAYRDMNPYRRDDFARYWKIGHERGKRSNAEDVQAMKHRARSAQGRVN